MTAPRARARIFPPDSSSARRRARGQTSGGVVEFRFRRGSCTDRVEFTDGPPGRGLYRTRFGSSPTLPGPPTLRRLPVLAWHFSHSPVVDPVGRGESGAVGGHQSDPVPTEDEVANLFLARRARFRPVDVYLAIDGRWSRSRRVQSPAEPADAPDPPAGRSRGECVSGEAVGV